MAPRGRPLSLDKLDGSSPANMHRPRLRSRYNCLSHPPKTRTAVIHGSGSNRLSARYLPFARVPKRTPTAPIAAMAAHSNRPARFFECNYASNRSVRSTADAVSYNRRKGNGNTGHTTQPPLDVSGGALRRNIAPL
jgi:hypothetical protein